MAPAQVRAEATVHVDGADAGNAVETGRAPITPEMSEQDVLASLSEKFRQESGDEPGMGGEEETEIDEEDGLEARESEAEDETEDEEASGDGEEPEGADDAMEVDAEVFATAMGLDDEGVQVEEDGTLKFRVKVDGEESFVTPTQLLRGYQTDVHNTKRSEKLAQDRQAFDGERVQHFGQLQHTMQGLQAVETALVQAYEADYQKVDWNSLREDDPGQYAAMQQDMNQRRQQLGHMIQQARNYQGQVSQQMTAQQKQQIAALKQQNLDKLMGAKPELRDEGKFQSFRTGLRSYLENQGYSGDEISGTMDARAIMIAEKARLWDESQHQGKAIEGKKVKRNVRVLKAGKPKIATSKATTAKRQKQLLARAVKSQSDADFSAVVIDRLGLIG